MNCQPHIPREGYLSPSWVQKYLSISHSTLYAWIAEGRLKAPVRISKRAVRFKAEDIAEFEAKLRRTNEQAS